jgi:predicted dehydrogenase/nucleoside-diphosphate-sugar epimerase
LVTRVGLVGTGNIADVHAVALRATPGVEIAAVADVARSRAERFARERGIAKVFSDVEELIASKSVEVAHVLTPPPLHRPVAEPLLRAGIHVFLEKPMATSTEECDALAAAARDGHARLRINHNFVFHPAHVEAKARLATGSFGRIRHVICHFNLPLRQLAARQLSHWMFDSPKNLLLEQAVHPLSQIDDLVGPAQELSVFVAPATQLGEGQQIYQTWEIALRGERATAQLHVSLGQSFPAWGMTIICDDGRIVVDYVNNRVTQDISTQWFDFYDNGINGSKAARELFVQSFRNVTDYGLSLLKLKPRSDAFYLSIKGSVASFYEALAAGGPDLDGGSGQRTVALCAHIAQSVPEPVKAPAISRNAAPERPYDIAVLGGTGFIGVHFLEHCLRAGKSAAVLARTPNNLPALYDNPNIGVFRGDVTNRDDVLRVIGDSKKVVNLAHGGGGSNWAEIERALVGSARTVAECCLEKGVERLIHVSTIAALYLGGHERIMDSTPVDPKSTRRGDYSRAKADAERALLDMHRTRNLPVCILRPGVVTGAGGLAFHSGIGFYNRDRHCLGWNAGTNPLPFVLAGDVADAMLKALEAPHVIGRCYNLVGDVRLTARDYIDELAKAMGRPLRYHPHSVEWLFAFELVKWAIKTGTGKPNVSFPSLRDLKSRGLVAQFDCSEAKRDLGWHPVADRETFLQDGIRVYGG